jgi:hypothetical protein
VGLLPIDQDLPALLILLNLCSILEDNPKFARLFVDKNILNPDFNFKVAIFLFILVNNELEPADLDKAKPLPG